MREQSTGPHKFGASVLYECVDARCAYYARCAEFLLRAAVPFHPRGEPQQLSSHDSSSPPPPYFRVFLREARDVSAYVRFYSLDAIGSIDGRLACSAAKAQHTKKKHCKRGALRCFFH